MSIHYVDGNEEKKEKMVSEKVNLPIIGLRAEIVENGIAIRSKNFRSTKKMFLMNTLKKFNKRL